MVFGPCGGVRDDERCELAEHRCVFLGEPVVGWPGPPVVPTASSALLAAAAEHPVVLADLSVPPFDPGCAYWLFTILVDDRDDFSAYLGERGIATSQVHARNDKHDAFKKVSNAGPLPGVDAFDARQVSIPNGFWVSDEQREYIARVIHEWAFMRARRAA